MRKITLIFMVLVLMPATFLFAQSKDKAKFKTYEPGFYQNFILKDVNAYQEKQKPHKKEKYFMMDQSGMDLPRQIENQYWHTPTTSQGNTGTCWCFSTTSFYESETYRLHQKKVKISEMFTVYWEYVEKVSRFVDTHGHSLVDEGSSWAFVPWGQTEFIPLEATAIVSEMSANYEECVARFLYEPDAAVYGVNVEPGLGFCVRTAAGKIGYIEVTQVDPDQGLISIAFYAETVP